ncbi:UNVERIFIED_CONTAM: hypothetical protein O8I53_06535 [Campylobacter lari]
MYYSPVFNAETNPVSSSDVVKNQFKPFNDYVKMFVNADSKLGVYDTPKAAVDYAKTLSLFSLSSENIKNNYGTSGLTTIKDLFSTSNLGELLAIYPQIFNKNDSDGSSLPEIDLFGTLDKIRDELTTAGKLTKPDFSSISNDIEKQKEAVSKYNEALLKFFENAKEGLTDDIYAEKVIKPIAELFETDKKVGFAYKIKGLSNARALLTPAGIKLIYFSTNYSYSDIVKMIENDFIISKRFKVVSGVKYDAINKINHTIPREEQIIEMLQDTEFKTYIMSKINPNALNVNGEPVADQNYTEKDLEKTEAIAKRFLKYENITNFITLSQAATKELETIAKDNMNRDLKIVNNVTYFTNNDEGAEGRKDGVTVKLVEFMRKLFNIDETQPSGGK